jgi:DNA-binding beta-propeller fold protein YncE
VRDCRAGNGPGYADPTVSIRRIIDPDDHFRSITALAATAFAVVLAAIFSPSVSADTAAAPYRIATTIPVGGTGHWDYLFADAPARRLYLSHNATVDVIDTSSGRRVGSIAVGGFSHGITVVEAVHRGYVTAGESSLMASSAHEVVVFDTRTLRVVQRVNVPKDPDGILYEPVSNSVIAFTGDSHTAVFIDAKTGHIGKSVDLKGSPEGAVADGKGTVFVNIADANEVDAIDAASRTVTKHWPIAGCEEPTGLAMDGTKRRLFSACANEVLAVIDADDGSLLAKVPIAPHNDATAFDPATHTIFTSTLGGMLSIVRDEGNDHYVAVQNLQTSLGSRTLALDEATHKVYLSSAKFGARRQGQKYPDPIEGSFAVLVVDASKS